MPEEEMEGELVPEAEEEMEALEGEPAPEAEEEMDGEPVPEAEEEMEELEGEPEMEEEMTGEEPAVME